jgi:methionyl-tRNA formyltransferase
MKIVCFIREHPPLIYFANKINSEFPVSLVVIEKPYYANISLLNMFSKIKKHGIYGSLIFLLKYKLFKRKEKAFSYSDVFGNECMALNENMPVMITDSVNSDTVFSRLVEIKPDLILDHGTAIVKDHILGTSYLALNLHYGLSPYYRGMYTTEWALLNWDPYNIGVTIHQMSKHIDGGSIVTQKRVQINRNDTAALINMRLTLTGTELILKIIKMMNAGECLEFKEQDLTLGRLTFIKQWNILLLEKIKHIESNHLIEKMLKNPSREPLPIFDIIV